MIESKIEFKTPDGTADGYLYQPESSSVWPAIIMYTDIFGVRPAFQDMAKQLAAEGYVVLLPNLYYRTRAMPVFKEKLSFANEKDRAQLLALKETLTPDVVRRDSAAHVDFLGKQKTAKAGAMGVTGYCMSGAIAMRTASARPDRILACASFHAGGLATDAPDSPHKLLSKAKARFYFGHASEDVSCPPEMIEKLEAACDTAHLQYESEVYPGKHGFAVKDHDVYDEACCEKHWRKLFALFAETLR